MRQEACKLAKRRSHEAEPTTHGYIFPFYVVFTGAQ